MSEAKKTGGKAATKEAEPKARKEKSKADRELWAMGAVSRAMNGLTPAAQERVINWAKERFPEVGEVVALAPPPEAPSGAVHPAMDAD